MRGAGAVAAAILAGSLLLVVLGTNVGPLSRTCAASLPAGACTAAIDAVTRRGLADLHPLILSAHVEPGAEPRSDQVGHRATVRFGLLAASRPLSIELHYDQGAHWGGVPDLDDDELAAHALAPLAVAGVAAVAILGLAWWRRARAPLRPRGRP